MAKIFKKLNVGDTVASIGTRVFKKLTTEEPSLPVWDGTDLTGTIWIIESGWSAEAGYGEFEVNCFVDDKAFDHFFETGYEMFCIGYAPKSSLTAYATTDSLCWRKMGFLSSFSDTTIEKPISFTGGIDATNPRLIDWMIKNADLVSHRMIINGTYLFNDTITELPIVYENGEDIGKQTAVHISFCEGRGANRHGFATGLDNEEKKLQYGDLLPANVYSFKNNSWVSDRCRYVTFYNAIAENVENEDVTHIFDKWLTTNATKQGQITFTIDGITYTADAGMCWMQWMRSDYNTAGYTTNLGGSFVYKGDITVNPEYIATAVADGIKEYRVKKSDVIMAGYNYVHYNTDTPIYGLFGGNGGLLVSWDTLVNTYGLDIEKDYAQDAALTDPQSIYSVMKNNGYFADGYRLVIPDDVTKVGAWALQNCNLLNVVDIGSGVQSIGNGAFYSCWSLRVINYRGTEEQWGEIEIGENNSYLLEATIHYNYTD